MLRQTLRSTPASLLSPRLSQLHRRPILVHSAIGPSSPARTGSPARRRGVAGNRHDLSESACQRRQQAPSPMSAAAAGGACAGTPPPLPPPPPPQQQQQQQQDQGVDDVELQRLLADAHCHPQLDPANLGAVPQLRCGRLAAMSVAVDVDWDLMLRLHELAGPKVIPAFGIHPWWSHLHGSSHGESWGQLLEAPSQEQLQAAADLLTSHDPVTDSGAYATNRPGQQGGGGGGGGEGVRQLGAGLRVVPREEWVARLRRLLEQVPTAIVGEVGIDRAATIPGTRAKTRLAHQLELLETQLDIAAEFCRPASVHCVRAYGHLADALARAARRPGGGPPRVMLHSYGGSPEDVLKFVRLEGIGPRVYFSFSAAINGRAPARLAERVAAVPDDRLLLESDQVSPLVIDGGMSEVCRAVAAIKGWGCEEAARRLRRNFDEFYSGQLAAAAAAGARGGGG